MVAILKPQSKDVSPPPSGLISLEDWLDSPVVGTEWVDGQSIEKDGMTLLHSKVQNRLGSLWRLYKDENVQGGEVYTEAPCRTMGRGRSPDVAYLTPELVARHGNAKVLPHSFPLCAEIVSPTDLAEDVVAKAQEYLASSGEEVWLVFPVPKWIIVVTATTRTIFVSGDVAKTQLVLPGFAIAVDELLG